MGTIENNIFELIEKGKYHSCILTTYSFDFLYFENVVLKRIHSLGVNNVSVMADCNMIDEALSAMPVFTTDRKNYSLMTIKSKGSFHPKLHMYFGDNDALLLIGSGNLTYNGLESNKEIWSAFHYNDANKEYEQVISNSFHYIAQLFNCIIGFNKIKIDWLYSNCPWVKVLPPKKLSFEPVNNGEAAFLYSGNGISMFQQLSEMIPFKEVETVTVVSPFYDEKGRFLESLRTEMPNGVKIKVVLTGNGGTAPVLLPKEFESFYNFYKWADSRRLHAKIIDFELRNKIHYSVFGSANASIAAFGDKKTPACNYEVSLLLKSDTNIISNLEIILSNKCKLAEFKNQKMETSSHEASTEYYIGEIDQYQSILYLYIDGPEICNNIKLRLFDCEGCFKEYNLISEDEHYIVEVDESFVYGQLWRNNLPVSNNQLIHNEVEIFKTKPNKDSKATESTIQELALEGEYFFIKLYESGLLEFDEQYEEDCEEKVSQEKRNSNKIERTRESELIPEKMTYTELKSLPSRHKLTSITNNRISRILDILRERLFDNRSENLQISKDIDLEKDDMESNLATSNENSANQKSKIILYDKQYECVDNMINEYWKHITDLIQKVFYKRKTINAAYKVSYSELSKFIIILYLIENYAGKQIEVEERNKGTKKRVIISLDNTDYKYQINALPLLCEDIIDSFLVMCTYGFKKYEDEEINNKIEQLRIEAVYHILFCVFNSKWKVTEVQDMTTIILNTITYLSSEKDFDKLLDIDIITKFFKVVSTKLKRPFMMLNEEQIKRINSIRKYVNELKKSENITVDKLYIDEFNHPIVRVSGLGYGIALSKGKDSIDVKRIALARLYDSLEPYMKKNWKEIRDKWLPSKITKVESKRPIKIYKETLE